MRIATLLALALLTFAPSCKPAPPQHTAPSPNEVHKSQLDLRLAIATDKPTYTLPEVVVLIIRAENVSTGPRFTPSFLNAKFRITRNGEIVVSATSMQDVTDWMPNQPVTLEPHEVRHISLKLGTEHQYPWRDIFLTPGKYTIQLGWLRDDKTWDSDGSIVSNTVAFEILPPAENPVPTPEALREKLLSGKEDQIALARKEILDQRTATVNMLISIIQDKNLQETNRPAVLAAACLLGNLRAPEAIPALLDIILLFEYGWYEAPPAGVLSWVNGSPAGDALIKIGLPAVNPLVMRLVSDDKSIRDPISTRYLCGFVIEDILGYHLTAQYLMKAAAEYPESSEERKRLESLAEYEQSAWESAQKGHLPPKEPGEDNRRPQTPQEGPAEPPPPAEGDTTPPSSEPPAPPAEAPVLSIEILTEKPTVVTNERAYLTVYLTNTGTTDAIHWNVIGTPEFRFKMTDSTGKELEWDRGPVAEAIVRSPIKPGERVVYTNVTVAEHFFAHNLEGFFPKPGDYTVWCEYTPGKDKNPDAPVVSKSNVITFHVESPNIVSEKHIDTEYLNIGDSRITKHEAVTFVAFLHKGKDSQRLYWTRGYSSYEIAANVIPDKYEMTVDKYGNTHVVYQTIDGKYFYFIRRNSTQRPPEDPLRNKIYPYPKSVPDLLETENNWLDVPAGYKPRLKLIEGTAIIEYIPETQPPDIEPTPADSTPQPPPAPPQVGVSQQTPAAQSTAWPWYAYALIALGVLIIGGAAYFVLSKRKK